MTAGQRYILVERHMGEGVTKAIKQSVGPRNSNIIFGDGEFCLYFISITPLALIYDINELERSIGA